MNELKPEAKVEIILWDWLKTKSESMVEIYFNRQNELNAPIFKIEGIQKKPDFILKTNNGYGDKYCVVEVKDSSSSLNILKADKIIDSYFKNYAENKTSYFIDGNKILIDYFLIATQDSVNGHLFKNENVLDNWSDESSKSKYAASKKYKIIPRFEGNRTFEYIRMLWHNYDKIRNNYENKIGLGIIIADIHNNNSPSMMITNFDKIKKRWGQRWWKI